MERLWSIYIYLRKIERTLMRNLYVTRGIDYATFGRAQILPGVPSKTSPVEYNVREHAARHRASMSDKREGVLPYND